MTFETQRLTFFHSPNTRSSGVRILLEELGADYDLHALDMDAGEQRGAAYMAINPMGKVPAVMHQGELVTEQVAVYLYLADLYPAAGLAPAIGDRLRGPYLRWMAFYGSCFEPSLMDRVMKRDAPPPATSPYGDAEITLKTVTDQLAKAPWMLGEQFSAVDVLWGAALTWTTMFGLVPETPMTKAYMARFNARPAVSRVRKLDADLAAGQNAARA
jgi:glutathione S-transferase